MTKSDIRKVGTRTIELRPLSHQSISVVYHCALSRDLALFESGDATEVGKKGLTLRLVGIYSDAAVVSNVVLATFSGGQKVMTSHLFQTMCS